MLHCEKFSINPKAEECNVLNRNDGAILPGVSDVLWRHKLFIDTSSCAVNLKKFDASIYAINFLQYLASSVIFLNVLTSNWKKSTKFLVNIWNNFVVLCASLKLKFQQNWTTHFFYNTSRLQVRCNSFSLNHFVFVMSCMFFNHYNQWKLHTVLLTKIKSKCLWFSFKR